MTNPSRLIRIYGALDILCLIYILSRSIIHGEIPVYGEIIEGMRAAESFDSNVHLIAFGVILGGVLNISLIFSGCLMLFLKRSGVLLSLAQAPLRLLLLTPLTFFFLILLAGSSELGKVYLFCSAIVLEVIKIVTQIYWLHQKKLTDLLIDSRLE